ncbi:MAG TPA: hydrolase [Verrucomicrobiae bacterium]|nr:hydrolase [Verrucomicrobiae bacterium]
MIQLSPETTALVLIDLQKGVVARECVPYTSEQVIETAKALAEKFRKAGATVVLVNVAWSSDFKDALRQPVDKPMPIPPGGFPANFGELVEGLAKPGDVLVTKRQWGAFYGTELDLQLRRRGVETMVLAGISTNIGVESTARQAWELGYALVLAEDATSGASAAMHAFAMENIFPRIGRIAKAAEIELK